MKNFIFVLLPLKSTANFRLLTGHRDSVQVPLIFYGKMTTKDELTIIIEAFGKIFCRCSATRGKPRGGLGKIRVKWHAFMNKQPSFAIQGRPTLQDSQHKIISPITCCVFNFRLNQPLWNSLNQVEKSTKWPWVGHFFH